MYQHAQNTATNVARNRVKLVKPRNRRKRCPQMRQRMASRMLTYPMSATSNTATIVPLCLPVEASKLTCCTKRVFRMTVMALMCLPAVKLQAATSLTRTRTFPVGTGEHRPPMPLPYAVIRPTSQARSKTSTLKNRAASREQKW